MKRQDFLELVLLAALWGASFLFIRLGASEFGPLALAWLRVAGAALVLLPMLVLKGEMPALRTHWRTIAFVGFTNSVVPFVLFGYALLTITGSLAAVFNAATPLFGAVIAWAWLKNRLDAPRCAGLVIGFAGVFWLVWDKASFKGDVHSINATLAVGASLLAALSYGFSANFTKRHAAHIPSMALATGSQISAAVLLAVPAWWTWPAASPSTTAWLGTIALAVLCTGFAYILFFRLIAHAGPANALSVTFLIPVFAMIWGAMFLAEVPTHAMLIGCAVILLGTALTTGLIGPRAARSTQAPAR
ncbi:MAG TPA: DMT family transporter, partial [Burkholderiaceae bacterium]|nr:DMT family transporter [Burkholderiaceae bacterium]